MEKHANGSIGLYLCCGGKEEDARFPVQVDYQLMARRRGRDDAVCCSIVYR